MSVFSLFSYVNKHELYKNEVFNADNYFANIEDITIDTIKMYYLTLMRNIKIDSWSQIYQHFIGCRKARYKSTTYISTEDAFNLVNGPTIYITQEVNKIAFFCIQCMNLPENIIQNISKAISINSDINKKITAMEKDYEDGMSKEDLKEKKVANDRGVPPELRLLKSQNG